MRARHRPLKIAAAAAALTTASLPLWASPAGAGGSPDESHTTVKTVTVGGVACEVRLSSARFGDFVQGFTQVITTADPCATQRISVGVQFETPHGDTAGAAGDTESSITCPGATTSGGEGETTTPNPSAETLLDVEIEADIYFQPTDATSGQAPPTVVPESTTPEQPAETTSGG